MERKDFINWMPYKPDWKEVAFQYNTAKKYQHKQDLNSVFGNAYIIYKLKLEAYFEEFQEIPYDFFDNLVFEFRESFPKNGRVEGINYFDDLIELLISKYFKPIRTTNEVNLQDNGATLNSKYFIPIEKIIKLYNFLSKESLIEEIEFKTFLHCFDKNSVPEKFPVFKPKSRFVYILSCFKDENNKDIINEIFALSHFNIKGYRQTKTAIKHRYKTPLSFKREVEQVLKDEITIFVK